MTARIAYTKPSITELEVSYATDAARNGWGAQCYDYLNRLERDFAAHLGVRHTIATSSCTGALHLGLAALGIGPGDEVIMADTNWIASVAPVVHLGATPVFVDILADTWCADPAQVEAAITPRTKAIMAVHLYGSMCDMNRLLDVGERHGIAIVEDAAEAIGSAWGEKRAGSMGAFGTFSFHGTKTMTTGEGGMFVTNDTALFEKVNTLSNHGRDASEPRQFFPLMTGYKFKMSNIAAAIGCAQMERIDELIDGKRRIMAHYRELLAGVNGISLNVEPAGVTNGYWMPTVVFDRDTGVSREQLIEAFKQADIDARVFFWPLSELPMFEARPGSTNARDIAARAINLPSYHDMDEAAQARVADVIKGALKA
ncbi:DegT/DnrJ/EryC1/StrS family aminotransferase [Hoeflea alexandrii]|uniref:Aminotransferase class V-fold PLP-dependent enzyme n=1 Tax=Hoeflea alexandrii TaxID=288436 RepID=A0ABT1CV03_9HYPH|nr:DegT/DnrJ/EryC1/StrS family aminotransferase [Hoeflea alexandrii]MCO6409370.1 aminotransferase class V-fold PLP-dependent enzyme [Hoeflea alexandrii]MCY0151964.1 DegT/DnrJ/EryC1/StrS family aminotransferase [Hoeflea alexandrii]